MSCQQIGVGGRYLTNNYGYVVVLEYNNSMNLLVKFENTNHEQTTSAGQVRNGALADRSLARTTEKAVALILSKFPHYDCSNVEYVNARSILKLICPIHGPFEKMFSDGFECQECVIERRIKSQTGTKEDFVKRSNDAHAPGYYDYSLVEYKTARVKVKIHCNIHNHTFEQSPYVHVIGKGCKLCANQKQADHRKADKEHFIKRSKQRHGDKYIYDRVDYKNAKTPVLVTCPIHGDFPTYPDNHWLGAGCPDCSEAGFSFNRPAILYVFQDDDLIKVGITNSQVEKRLKAICKSTGRDFKLVTIFNSDDGLFINNLETDLLSELREHYKQPIEKFDGYTECFYDVNLPELLNTIKQKLENVNAK